MENLKLSLTIDDGKFQIYEEIDEQESFSFLLAEGKTLITNSQQLAEIIEKALTKIKEEMPIVITISDDEVMFTRGNILSINLDCMGGELHVSTCDGSSYYFADDQAIKFLNHFPYSYFEKAKNLAELYKTNWSDNTF